MYELNCKLEAEDRQSAHSVHSCGEAMDDMVTSVKSAEAESL
jgi:hypothetical protein